MYDEENVVITGGIAKIIVLCVVYCVGIIILYNISVGNVGSEHMKYHI